MALVVRRMAAAIFAGVVFGWAVYAAYTRGQADRIMVFVNSPREIVGSGHIDQVDLVRRIVPRGSTIFYLMDTFEGWQSGLWQRSLYPDYDLEEVTGLKNFTAPKYIQMRVRKRVEYVLSAGNPPLDPGFSWRLALPTYPNGIPIVLGKLGPE